MIVPVSGLILLDGHVIFTVAPALDPCSSVNLSDNPASTMAAFVRFKPTPLLVTEQFFGFSNVKEVFGNRPVTFKIFPEKSADPWENVKYKNS